MTYLLNHIDQLGRIITKNLEYTVRVCMMAYLSLRAAIKDPAQGMRTIVSVISAQIYFTGWQALPLMSVLAIASGSIVILQASSQFNLLGGTEMVGKLIVVVLIRELIPLVTALVVIARSGTAVASEVGNMRTNREIEALEAIGINPMSFIVFPRLLGGVISVVCLAFYFAMIAILGGFAATKLLIDIPFSFYFDSISQALAVEDLWLFLLKNIFGGMIIFVVSCYQGLSVGRSPTEVPVATTKAVMNSIIYVVVFNMSVTALFYLNQLMKLGVV